MASRRGLRRRPVPSGGERSDFIDGVVAAARKGGAESLTVLSDDVILSDVREWVPSGYPSVDYALGGGWPVGRASEVYGVEGSGKSSLGHMAMLGAQRMGGYGVLFDAEAALDRRQLRQLGLDLNRTVYCTPDHMEQVWDSLRAVLDRVEKESPSGPVVVVWDSVAATRTKAEIEAKSAEDRAVSSQARVMAEQCSNRLLHQIARTRCHVMFINQVRDTMGAIGPFRGQAVHTPGGRALKFVASLRVECRRIATLPKQGHPKTGFRLRAKATKNRLAPPFREGRFVIDFARGPSPALSLFEELRDAGKIRSSGGGRYKLSGASGLPDAISDGFTRGEWADAMGAPGAADVLWATAVHPSGPLEKG